MLEIYSKSSSRPWILWLFLSALSVIGVFFHEPWRDELQAWLIAVHSHSITDLLSNSRYEGHPLLWFLMIKAVSLIYYNPLSMQLMHAIIGSAIFWLILFKSPFSRSFAMLLCLSYFLFYEYNLIARNYSISVILIFLLTIRFKDEYSDTVVLFLLALLANTNILGLIFSICFFVLFIFRIIKICSKTYILLFSLSFLTILGITIYYLWPPSDSGFAVQWHYEPKRIFITISAIFKAFFPFPMRISGFWDTSLFTDHKGIRKIGGCILFLLFVFVFQRKRNVLLFYLLSTVLLISFFEIKYLGTFRHHGYFLVAVIVCLWIYFQKQENNDFPFNSGIKYLLYLIFACQAFCGLKFYATDIIRPFSNCKPAADWIIQNKLDTLEIVGDRDFSSVGFAAYLNKLLYYPASKDYGSFVKWDLKRKYRSSTQEIFNSADSLSILKRKDVLLILNYPLNGGNNVKYLKSFTNAMVGDENYFLYKIPLIP